MVSFGPVTARRTCVLATSLLMGFTLVTAPAVSAADERTHVLISGPRSDWHPRPRWLLEVGGKEWVIIGSKGVVAVTDLPAVVVIRELGKCRALFSFTARDRGPGDGYWVRVDSAGRFEVEATTGFNEGPYALPSSGNRCPDLPDTSTVGTGAMAPAPIILSVLDRLLSAIGRLF